MVVVSKPVSSYVYPVFFLWLQLYKVDVEEEDIIVTATDGLLDNLYDQEILLIATKSLADGKTPKVQLFQILTYS